MNIRLLVRNLTNSLVHLLPRAGWIHLLKSLAAQPKLQDRLKFHVMPYRYDSPIPRADELDLAKLRQPRLLPGVRFDEERIQRRLDDLQPYAEEFGSRPLERLPDAEFWFRNHSYEDLDAITLYSMIRHVKPRRIIEVGCGHSSRVISIAARRNATDGSPAECSFIEPYPSELLKSFALAGPLIEKRIEHVPLSFFQELQAGDVLFIDTSHVVKAQNDCCYELLTLLPSLPAGVYVHVHDIF
ncbi:MAG TPA: class I SAM-dependent methyltransferase, partial [Chthoniobacteraceae bacterium]|nr:class I SAM-dependent methyltransferase [Chthoniobacteraceae bacterium]